MRRCASWDGSDLTPLNLGSCSRARTTEIGLLAVAGAATITGMPHPLPHMTQVEELLRTQAPHLAQLPLRPSEASGSSNLVFRLGDDLAVRVPRTDEYVDDLRAELQWLPRLAPQLSTPIPEIVFAGEPSDVFPRPWSVVSWVRGEPPRRLDAGQQDNLARTLGAFLRELHAADSAAAPAAGQEKWGYRCGEPVSETMDRWLDETADSLSDRFDPAAVREAWRRLRDVPAASQGPCWVHTDVSTENILINPDGCLAGVIDWGCVGIGDPSIDLLYAWSQLDAPARNVLRESAGADEATWLRARAWAFVGPGLMTIDSYGETLPERTALLTRQVEAVAAEVGVSLRG